MKTAVIAAIAGFACAGAAFAQSGSNIPAAAGLLGAPLLASQANASNYGAGPSGGQLSNGSSRLDAIYGTISGGTLNLLITGNLESNYNKMWIFFDTGAAGQNVLRDDNNDGGFNEIRNMRGMRFDAGFTPSQGMRIELGRPDIGNFVGIRGFSLPAMAGGAGGDVLTNSTSNLPLSDAAGAGLTMGWDNSGTGSSGFNFAINLGNFFGDANLSTIRVMAFVTNGGADNLSNQVLASGNSNYPSPQNWDWTAIAGDQFVTVVPAPGAAGLLVIGGILAGRRRRA